MPSGPISLAVGRRLAVANRLSVAVATSGRSAPGTLGTFRLRIVPAGRPARPPTSANREVGRGAPVLADAGHAGRPRRPGRCSPGGSLPPPTAPAFPAVSAAPTVPEWMTRAARVVARVDPGRRQPRSRRRSAPSEAPAGRRAPARRRSPTRVPPTPARSTAVTTTPSPGTMWPIAAPAPLRSLDGRHHGDVVTGSHAGRRPGPTAPARRRRRRS